jgi:hypothetical protein
VRAAGRDARRYVGMVCEGPWHFYSVLFSFIQFWVTKSMIKIKTHVPPHPHGAFKNFHFCDFAKEFHWCAFSFFQRFSIFFNFLHFRTTNGRNAQQRAADWKSVTSCAFFYFHSLLFAFIRFSTKGPDSGLGPNIAFDIAMFARREPVCSPCQVTLISAFLLMHLSFCAVTTLARGEADARGSVCRDSGLATYEKV